MKKKIDESPFRFREVTHALYFATSASMYLKCILKDYRGRQYSLLITQRSALCDELIGSNKLHAISLVIYDYVAPTARWRRNPFKKERPSDRRSAAILCFRHHYLRSAELSGPSSESAFIPRILSRISESPQSDEPSLNALASAISGGDDCDRDGQVRDARVSLRDSATCEISQLTLDGLPDVSCLEREICAKKVS